MIIVDVINSIFDILPQLILATSPACVFAGMGSGSQSGKLTFKKIFSGEGIDITQDETSLMFKVTGGSKAIGIDSCEIVIGNSTTGITGSNNIKVCEAYKAITGVAIISGTFSPTAYALCNEVQSSLIIGGRTNHINYYSYYSNIIGGTINSICASTGYKYYGTILGGRCNKICEGSGSIITSQSSKIYSACISNSIISGIKNCICPSTNANYTSIIGGCCNSIGDGRYSSAINSFGSTITNNFNASINSIGSTKMDSFMFVDIGGYCNVSQFNLSRSLSTISSKFSNNLKCSNDISIISSCSSYTVLGTGSSVISSDCTCIYGSYGSIISSCVSKICSGGPSHSRFNSIISSYKGEIRNSCGSSIISSGGATVSCSVSSTILSSNCGVIYKSNGSILSNISGFYNRRGIYNSTFSAAFFRQCSCINNSVNSVIISGVNNEMKCSINGASIGLYNLKQSGSKPSFRNVILSFDTACITSEGATSSDNFISGCYSSVLDTFRSSIISSTCTSLIESRDSSIIGSYFSCIMGSTSSVIIGSRCTKIENSRNSAIIAGWPGSCLSGCCETTRTAHLNIHGSVIMNSTSAVGYCSWPASPISSITVCNGIITAIS